MALTKLDHVNFWFQNSNGVFYELVFVADTGVGVAYKHGATIKSTPRRGLTKVDVTVDGASLAAWKTWHDSRRIYSAVYETTQDLDTVLNAAS